ncbi:MAG TPA: DUF2059 domain-containing protein [Candidatus Cybelea sp.]|jgi:uncharacterized protein|nr:DUF2059 domain-containing protein [Candidatus Cybelea sp.]
MKRIFLALAACLVFGLSVLAQQSPVDAPATKEDIQKYLEIMHSREMMTKMIDAMSKPMHQIMHERYLKDKDKLPPDFEERMNKVMDVYMKNLPFEEMLQAMIPAYQKHLTKGDIDALVAFYSSPTGQKLIQELPAITAEAMQSMMPLMRKQMDVMNQHMQEQIAEMIKESGVKPAAKSQASPN